MKNKRLLSLGLTVVLAASVCGCGESTETAGEAAEEPVEETAGAPEIAEKVVSRAAGGNTEKEETVYVNADASGNVKEITVSSWLKNGEGAEELRDVTTLTDVVNIKGDETFTKDGDTYVWAAGGNDIYYQGETSEALPVDVQVTYYLDDQKIDPKELAGKSGKVRIRFDYENRTAQQTQIGKETASLCVPFVAASTMILDSDKFVNVEVENGKILSDGKNTIVAGVAMPGLYDSLDLLNLEGFEDVDIPEYVEVTADVTDFELSMTATILMPDVLSQLNTEDMDGFDDLKEDIEELNDATYDLIDGCIELDDGVQELKDNMPDLWDGAVELDDGAQKLDDGAWELDGGAQDLLDGAGDLNDGARTLRNGAKELDEGAGALQAGAGLLNDNMPALTGGVNQLAAGLQSLQNPMMLGPDGKSGDVEHPYIKTSVGQLKNGVDQLASGVGGMGSVLEQKITENREEMQKAETTVALLADQLKAEVEEAKKIQGQLDALAVQMGMLLPENSAEPEVKAASDAAEEKDAEEPDEVVAPLEETPSAALEDPKEPEETIDASKDSEKPAASSESQEEPTEGSSDGAKEEQGTDAVSEQTEPVSDAQEDSADEEAVSLPEEPEKEESDLVSEITAEEETEDSQELSEAEEVLFEADELTAFGKEYLESLSESEGMTSMSMVLTADGGQKADATDAAAIIEGYKKVVDLLLELTGKLNDISDLQEQLREAATAYAALAGADRALTEVAAQLSAGADAEQLAQLTQGMAALETSVGQIYDGVDMMNRQMGALTGGAAELQQGVGSLKTGADALKTGTAKLYQGGTELKKGTRKLYDGTVELKDGTEELKDGTKELKDGTEELKDGVVDLVDGVDELKDGTTELLDGVHEYNDDGIQKLYDTVTVDLQNLLDRVDAVADLSENYQSFSGKSDAMEGSVKFIIETEAIELEEEE